MALFLGHLALGGTLDYMVLDRLFLACYHKGMSIESLAKTPLPVGYDKSAVYLRRWLLDLRLRLNAVPTERKRMLEARLYEFNGRKRFDPNGRRSEPYCLAKAVQR